VRPSRASSEAAAAKVAAEQGFGRSLKSTPKIEPERATGRERRGRTSQALAPMW